MDHPRTLSPPEEASLTPILRQYRDLHREVPHALLFFQVGDFYETFFEDAIRASELLGITLTTRNRHDPNPVPMAGVPVLHAEGYWRKALRQGVTLAICDQVGEEKSSSGPMVRRITRILTPGTALLGEGEEPGVDLESWIWIYVARGDKVGLIRHEFVSGRTAYGVFSPAQALPYLLSSPVAELLSEEDTPLPQELKQKGILFRFLPAQKDLEDPLKAGIAILTAFLQDTQRVELKHLSPPEPFLKPFTFAIDPRTLKNLEIFANLWNGGEEGTLFHLLKRCQTRMGLRLLKEWLRFPLTEPKRIVERQEKIRELKDNPTLLIAAQRALKGIPDLHHLVARLSQKSATPETLHQIRRSLGQARLLLELPDLFLSLFRSELLPIRESLPLWEDLEKTLHPQPPRTLKEGGVISPGRDPLLDELRSFSTSVQERLLALEQRERERTQIPTLKVGYNRVFGYYIEVPHTHRHKVPADYYSKQTLSQSERFIIPELKSLEVDIEENRERILKRESELYAELLTRVEVQMATIQRVAESLAFIDAVSTLALVAREQRWEFPRITQGFALHIQGGRHPVLAAQGKFVPNDTHIDEENHFLLITGPNMGGKSTYLRQIALIVILAQIGSAVPADSAEIGIVDQIFTRMGASDALWMGRSTFMVEMEETAQFLRALTPRSLVILDEIGRGTSTYDGISLAQAVSEYLVAQKVRTLFATHFHELIALGNLRGVKLLHPRVHVQGGEVSFLYTMEPGGSPHSYGIHVARAAGLPTSVVTRAEEILSQLESGTRSLHPSQRQLKLFP